MNRLLSYITKTICILTALTTLHGCEDRLDYDGGPLPEGISTVDVSMGFTAFTDALDSRAAGNAIKAIDQVWVVVYDKDNKFIKKEEITTFTKQTLDPRPGMASSETATGHVEFKMTLPNGYYRIYAVVNHSLATVDDTAIDTPQKLRELDLEWKSGDVRQNSEMFGWFVNGNKDTDHGTDAPVVTIRDNNSSLHAWVRRAASKLTIAFDTTDLNENVYIYLKSVTVKDIPKHCYLGSTNDVAADGYKLESKLVQGESIYFGNAQENHNPKADHGQWPSIASGTHVYGLYSDRHGRHSEELSKAECLALEHSEAAEAVYFYENMQPDGQEGTVTDKRQDVSGENIQISYPNGTHSGSHDENGNLLDDAYTKRGWKDGKQWGSYVEVKAYYDNQTTEHPGKGEITYRFMLGKDTRTNYEAERNHHYRLTMKFNKHANDIDFHIDYEEEAKPGLYSPDTAYVSYLYNQPGSTVVRATPKPGYDFFKLEAVIIENQWAQHPVEQSRHLFYSTAWDMQRNGTGDYAPRWVYNESEEGGWNDNKFFKRDPEIANNTEFGFLSLREVETVTKGFGGYYHADLIRNFRRAYFKAQMQHSESDPDRDVSGPLNWRVYDELPKSDGQKEGGETIDGKYTFTRTTNPNNGEIDYVGVIPLYTRAKTLDVWAAYSGANPFYEHQRYAKVKFIAHYKSKTSDDEYTDVSYTNVIQARRIDNPRGIYRRYDNDDAFDITLSYMLLAEQADGQKFEELISQGPWTATIECDKEGLVQLSANGQIATGELSKITGRTKTPVRFKYTPRGKLTDDTRSRGAIITVTYHNNSCTHKILVRQGYATHVIGKGKTKWSSFNVYDSENLCRSPLSVGSMFRRNTDLSYPILEKNNDTWGVGVNPPAGSKLKIAGKDDTGWEDIPNAHVPTDDAFTNMTLYNHIQQGKIQYRLPTFAELAQLGIVTTNRDHEQNVDEEDLKNVEDINYAFGITYADGATKTLFTTDAYGYTDYDNKGIESEKGVRGVIVYSRSKGDNVHFPLGASGHARRKYRDNSSRTAQKAYGLMRYGSVDYRLEGHPNYYRPMAWDLPAQNGAAYWINSGQIYALAIDFNYGNYMANYLNRDDLYLFSLHDGWAKRPDALPIRPVNR